jgi:L-fuconolactonase
VRIDSHQHYWRPARGDYGWLTPALGPLHRDVAPADLAPHLAAGGIDGTVLVQAAPTEGETDFLLGIAHATPSVLGVVGWVDFAAPEAPARIAARAADPLLKSLRPMVQDIADPHWLQQPSLDPAFDALIAHDLAFDALVRPPQLPALLRRLHRHPTLRVVIDHGAKPAIRDQAWQPWANLIAAAAEHPATWVKLSGLATEAAPGWTLDTLRPYADHLRQCFGSARILWGSDWPVLERNGDYAGWLAAAEALCAGLAPAERAAVFGANAARCYRLEPRPC